LDDPARVNVQDDRGRWVATFTEGARSVALRGTPRTFSESTAEFSVFTTRWVRLLPEPFDGTFDPDDQDWLDQARDDRSPDVLRVAAQYVAGASPLQNDDGRRIAGDATYGPPTPDGDTHQEGSDFNDYLGIAQEYARSVDPPEADQRGSMDCSGFVRMVFGYRHDLPYALSSSDGEALPRRAHQMLRSAPGVVTLPNRDRHPGDFSTLTAGDLVFFDASDDDGAQVDHVGIYLGRDNGGHHRFISSRKTANGPTLGDLGGDSILDGTGYYARAFRAARRL
jgi:cell wall-associated NlpC family hydrolase